MAEQNQIRDLYLKSKKNLEGDSPDFADKVIVALYEMNLENTKKVISYEKVINEQSKKLADQYHELDLLKTRLAIADGTYKPTINIEKEFK